MGCICETAVQSLFRAVNVVVNHMYQSQQEQKKDIMGTKQTFKNGGRGWGKEYQVSDCFEKGSAQQNFKLKLSSAGKC